MKRCYLAGPMRGRGSDAITKRFNAAAVRLRHAGWIVINPVEMDVDGEPLVRVISRDVDSILSLDPKTYDALVLLEGYSLSTGARAELAIAQWYRLRTLTFTEALSELEGDDLEWAKI